MSASSTTDTAQSDVAIYNTWIRILDEHPEINEIGLLPENIVVSPTDTELAPFFLLDGKLGLPESTIVPLYRHARQKLWRLTQRPDSTLGHQDMTCNKVNVEMFTNNYHPDIEKASRCLLLLQPENYSAVNMRRRWLQDGHVSLDRELHWTKLALTTPNGVKSSICWAYRHFLLEQETLPYSDEIIERELKLTECAFTLHPRNYYAWMQRTRIIKSVVGLEKGNEQVSKHNVTQALETEKKVSWLWREYNFILNWTSSHLSDSAAWHYRGHICVMLAALSDNATEKFWYNECNRVMELIERYPGHEAVWCYLRVVLQYSIQNATSDDSFLCRLLNWSAGFTNVCHIDNMENINEKCDEGVRMTVHNVQQLNVLERQLQQQQARHATAFRLWMTATIPKTDQTKKATLAQPPPPHMGE